MPFTMFGFINVKFGHFSACLSGKNNDNMGDTSRCCSHAKSSAHDQMHMPVVHQLRMHEERMGARRRLFTPRGEDSSVGEELYSR